MEEFSLYDADVPGRARLTERPRARGTFVRNQRRGRGKMLRDDRCGCMYRNICANTESLLNNGSQIIFTQANMTVESDLNLFLQP